MYFNHYIMGFITFLLVLDAALGKDPFNPLGLIPFVIVGLIWRKLTSSGASLNALYEPFEFGSGWRREVRRAFTRTVYTEAGLIKMITMVHAMGRENLKVRVKPQAVVDMVDNYAKKGSKTFPLWGRGMTWAEVALAAAKLNVLLPEALTMIFFAEGRRWKSFRGDLRFASDPVNGAAAAAYAKNLIKHTALNPVRLAAHLQVFDLFDSNKTLQQAAQDSDHEMNRILGLLGELGSCNQVLSSREHLLLLASSNAAALTNYRTALEMLRAEGDQNGFIFTPKVYHTLLSEVQTGQVASIKVLP